MIVIDFWFWWIGAAVLGAINLIERSGVCLWIGVVAFSIGAFGVAMGDDLAAPLQVMLFVALAIFVVFATRLATRRDPTAGPRPTLNRRGHQYIGQEIVLQSAIVNGRGRAFVGDTLWTVEGIDLPEGETVRVIGTDGVLLQVEKASTPVRTPGLRFPYDGRRGR